MGDCIKDDTEAIRINTDEILARVNSIRDGQPLVSQRRVEMWIEEMTVLSTYAQSTCQGTIADTTEYIREDSPIPPLPALQVPSLPATSSSYPDVLGDEQPDTLQSMHDLACTYLDQDRFKEAEALLTQVVEKRTKVLGDEHPDTLKSMHELAYTYGELGQHKEAETLWMQVVEKRTRVLGDEDPDTLRSMHDLASTYKDQGRFKEAESLWLQVVKEMTRVLGKEQPNTLRSMHNLASTYED